VSLGYWSFVREGEWRVRIRLVVGAEVFFVMGNINSLLFEKPRLGTSRITHIITIYYISQTQSSLLYHGTNINYLCYTIFVIFLYFSFAYSCLWHRLSRKTKSSIHFNRSNVSSVVTYDCLTVILLMLQTSNTILFLKTTSTLQLYKKFRSILLLFWLVN